MMDSWNYRNPKDKKVVLVVQGRVEAENTPQTYAFRLPKP